MIRIYASLSVSLKLCVTSQLEDTAWAVSSASTTQLPRWTNPIFKISLVHLKKTKQIQFQLQFHFL